MTVNGKVVETLKTDANGNAVSSQKYAVGTVLTIKETKAPAGYKLDTKTYTYTVTSGNNVISVSDIPVFDPPFVLTKVDKDTTTPQGDGSFTGAVFKWEFYANSNWSGNATRTCILLQMPTADVFTARIIWPPVMPAVRCMYLRRV